MKHVLSVSIGSSKRNHRVEIEVLGEQFIIERIGTDGDIKKAIEIIKENDGKVSAFGMGGIDLYVCIGNKRYTIKDAVPIAKAAKISPIVDGSGLKNTLERKVVDYLIKEKVVDFKNKKVLLVCGMDRFGMAEALEKAGCDLVLGDLIFALGVPIPLKSLKSLNLIASIVAPVVCKLPFSLLYPTGEKQEKKTDTKFGRFYDEADVIAGDFHFIKRHLPMDISGKIILTNTVTADDVAMLTERGAKMLITTTPKLNGRSFGTNVMEGVLVSLSQKPYKSLTPADYDELLDKIGFTPRIEVLN
ncbi:MAG TPA: quinate 5-dehydrogenase [Thermoanaerobacterales bacterium]|uniref:quinate 5-dehydrogenase n=1 Tax=Tepidanaerobacter sp. GT38 TaxID=2722793 RepID=UPI0017A2DE76|nr:quinate 5-dehydrogenase [Tepidanaerobacter sp. GT38]MCG1012858.1 quinate 5-dehydrogenase [Tepidanaerobacter sp. GT38]HHY42182.1 quinate 5-dehydrogenase [Thermoanaerobacterales bacterium]